MKTKKLESKIPVESKIERWTGKGLPEAEAMAGELIIP
jgi:hypothetical protein